MMEMNPKDMEDFEKVVLAGMRLMYSKETFDIFKRGMMRKNVPLPLRLATEAAGLMKMLDEKSGGSIPVQIIAPAGAMLLMEMGKFMKEAGVEAPTSDQVREATGLLMQMLKKMFGEKKPEAGQQPAAAPQQAQPPQPAAQPAPQAAPQMPPPQGGGGLLTQPMGM